MKFSTFQNILDKIKETEGMVSLMDREEQRIDLHFGRSFYNERTFFTAKIGAFTFNFDDCIQGIKDSGVLYLLYKGRRIGVFDISDLEVIK